MAAYLIWGSKAADSFAKTVLEWPAHVWFHFAVDGEDYWRFP